MTLSSGCFLIALWTCARSVTAFKIFSVWYSREQIVAANGLSWAAGYLGAMARTMPRVIPLVIFMGNNLVIFNYAYCLIFRVYYIFPWKMVGKIDRRDNIKNEQERKNE